MSRATDTDVAPAGQSSHLFSRLPSFPPVTDRDLDISLFLQAADGIRSFVHILGPTLFSPVTSDIQGNMDKISKIRESDADKYQTVKKIVEQERDVSGFRTGTDALLWLTRTLDFVSMFLTLWMQDHQSNQQKQDLTVYFKNAYDMTLKRYHNWLVQKVVFVVLSGAPSRDQLLHALFAPADGQPDRTPAITEQDTEQLFQAIDRHVKMLNENVACLRSLFDDVQFDWKV